MRLENTSHFSSRRQGSVIDEFCKLSICILHNSSTRIYSSFFCFIISQIYEEELEKQDLQAKLDRTHHGSRRRSLVPTSPEGGVEFISSEENSIEGKTNGTAAENPPRPSASTLTDSQGALAALEAMSTFRSLNDVQTEMKGKRPFHVNKEQSREKKLRVVDEVQSERSEVVDETMKKMWKNNWDVFVEGKKKDKYNEVAIKSIALPLSVDAFNHHVLEDNAEHSIGKFMRDIGELDVKTSPWQLSKNPSASEPRTRTINYTHPVNAPMAPPKAKARKQQYLHKFGDIGLCLETCTVVEEVPMADCFVVNDRIWVSKAEGEDEGCTVAVTFQIKFIKSTMFRRIIDNATRKEYGTFWGQFSRMIQSLKTLASLEVEALEEVAIELERATSMFGGEGTEVPLSTAAMGRIRRTSRRLSVMAKISPEIKEMDLETLEEKPEIEVQTVPTFALDSIAYLRKLFSESGNGLALACVVVFFLALFNVLALKQMMTMNRLLHGLDGRLGKMNELNEILLSKLASDIADVSCDN